MRTSVVFLALFSLGCQKHVQLDGPYFREQLEQRASAALATPPAQRALDELFEGVAADPQASQSGQRLLSALGADPGLQPVFGQLIADLGQSPVVQRMVRDVMREHPAASPDEVGALVEKRIGAIVDGPVFDKAFDSAFETVLQQRDVRAVMQQLEAKVGAHSRSALRDTLDRRLTDTTVHDKIVRWNGGSVPEPRKATSIVLDRLFTAERLALWYAQLYRLPAFKRELVVGCAQALETTSFKRMTTELVATLFANDAFRKRVYDGMLVLFQPKSSDQRVEAAVRALVGEPVVASALATWMTKVMADPELGTIGERALRAIWAAPEVPAHIAGLFDEPR